MGESKVADSGKGERERLTAQEVATLLKSLMHPGTGLDAVLADYADNVAGTGLGVCHDLATAIIEDLHKAGQSEGWEWCQGLVDDGVEHSWVEVDGFCIDMGDTGKLRVHSVLQRPFQVRGIVVRRSPEDTIEWIDTRSSKRSK